MCFNLNLNVAWLLKYETKLKFCKMQETESKNTKTGACKITWPHTLFICVTCSLPEKKTGKFTCVYAASTQNTREPPAAACKLSESSGFFRGNLACKTRAKLPAISMQKSLLSLKNTCNLREKKQLLQAIHWHDTAGKLACTLQVKLPTICLLYYVRCRVVLPADYRKIYMKSSCKNTCKIYAIT